MSNFLIKSKDMFFSNPQRYKHFEKVFAQINAMAVAKNYYATELFNIEEILSIIEMNSFVGGHQFRNEFLTYLKDVIEHFTPAIEPYGNFPSNWEDFAFGRNDSWAPYGFFVANLCNFRLGREENQAGVAYVCTSDTSPLARYSVVTLNYDLVLESVCAYVRDSYRMDTEIGFCQARSSEKETLPVLAKLHGSVEGMTIVPPTWSKGTHPEIVPAWRSALDILRQANHIRFIGYSLPSSDAYVRYLLKSAAMDSPHLKSIDVICLDLSGAVRKRYDEFVTFDYYRFANTSTENYLKSLLQLSSTGIRRRPEAWRKLEQSHETFMQRA